MASRATLRSSTAYPQSQLRAIMIEEVLRRLRNCSPGSSWEEKGKHLTEFALSLKSSGHGERFRVEVFNKALPDTSSNSPTIMQEQQIYTEVGKRETDR